MFKKLTQFSKKHLKSNSKSKKLSSKKLSSNKSSSKKSSSKKSSSKKSSSKKSSSKTKQYIPDEIIQYNLSKFIDFKTATNFSETNKKYNKFLKKKIENFKLEKDIENTLTIHSRDIYDIVEQYYWKQYKKGNKYAEIYESSQEQYDEFLELYENDINYDHNNYVNFIKNKMNYNDLPDNIKSEVTDKNLTLLLIYNNMEIFYNKQLVDKKSDLYKLIKQKL